MAWANCYRKKPYPDEDAAIQAAHNLQIRDDYNPKEGKTLNAYLCGCGKWHIGHSKKSTKGHRTMKKEFLIERQGKQFALYAGLLDLAHEKGLKSITTAIVQLPTEENKRTAICTATVVFERDGVERTFTGIGDAAPNNVAPAMQTCLIRMAETRSKARALRDGTNIGVAAFEELGDDGAGDDNEGDAPYPARTRPNRPQSPNSNALRVVEAAKTYENTWEGFTAKAEDFGFVRASGDDYKPLAEYLNGGTFKKWTETVYGMTIGESDAKWKEAVEHCEKPADTLLHVEPADTTLEAMGR